MQTTNKKMDPSNSIPAFFAGRSIFVTGATGFMGKALLEKLLWSCPDIHEIFLLMRPKKKMGIDDRLRHMLTSPIFMRLRETRPKALEKLIPIQGDISAEGLGLPSVERRVLIERVSIIFHVAASVRFNDPLKDAIIINTRSTRDICILAASMKNLVALMHVSTTYCQSDKYIVEEQLYPSEVDWKKIIRITETLNDSVIEPLTSKLIGNFPNTYTFAKRLAEGVVADYAGILPIIVFRPSIVISSVDEPLVGWLDNFNGPVGMMVGAGKGILRVIYFDSNTNADFIPVDVVIKAMITSTWKRGIVTITRDPSIHVYNCSSSDIRGVSMSVIVDLGLRFTEKIPLENILWVPQVVIASNKYVYYILTLLLHLLPSLVIDMFLKFAGKKPMLFKLQKKVYAANNALLYFLTNEWKFKNKKMLTLLTDISATDVNDFGFDYAAFSVETYFSNCIVGAKKYLLNEDMNKVKEAKIHYDRMYWIDKCFKIWILIFAIWFVLNFNILPTNTGLYIPMSKVFQ
ncbi:PREDICTED: putative fatty acyl-CoA reductase CG5065 [Ceratosolen solmsi marchali]|uniref:Fatty acyl-CoA reductase n=1 Tax=Ceratosolen solmsi marchali TaxID=326594 RepID=A0AAJ6YJ35_9HYME|nr:PREDICTED: putative fatty acyl-CoA reductase CG5065 [Ceratosolen solmsi marchali]